MSDLRERVEALAGRRHSGTGILVYDNDADQVGKSWCSGCSKWLTPDEWRQPCTSRKERRKGERRALLAPREEEAGLRQRVADYLYDDHGQGYDGLSELEARNQSLLDADRLISITRLAKGRPAPADALRADELIDRIREDTCSEDDEGVPFYDASLADKIIRDFIASRPAPADGALREVLEKIADIVNRRLAEPGEKGETETLVRIGTVVDAAIGGKP